MRTEEGRGGPHEWHFHFFGEVKVVGPDKMVRRFDTVRSAKLLVLLCLAHNGRMTREGASLLLWPEDPPESSRLRLRQEIHRVKRALGEDSTLIGTSSQDIWVDRDQIQTDLDLFSRNIRAQDVPIGEFLPGWEDPWVYAERTEAVRLRIQTVICLATSLSDSGSPQSALDLAQPFVRDHPLHEDLRMVLVNAYAQLGKMASAVAEYQEFRRLMREELGVELDPALPTTVAAPPRSVESRDWRGTIPVVEDETLGREAEIAEIASLFTSTARHRLVTLVGPGGIGKTRVATEVMITLSPESKSRLAFVSLSDIQNPKDWILSAVAQLSFEIPEEAPPLEFLATALDREPTILVIDNAETVLPEGSEDIQRLLKHAPSLRLLLTSVTPTRLPGERIVGLGPIDTASAGVQLLRRGMLSFRKGRPVTAEEEAELQALAGQLDGYPLALRLASARLRLLSPKDLRQQLEASLATSRDSGLPERHRSLESALSSSVESLAPAHRVILEEMAAFPGGMGMELASFAFCGQNYLDVFEDLLDTALVLLDEREGPVHVRLLAPVRKFVLGQIEPDRKLELNRSAAEHTLAFLAAIELEPWGAVSIEMLARADADHENIRFAWAFALQHDPLMAMRAAPAVAAYESCRARAWRCLDEISRLSTEHPDAPGDLLLNLQLAMAHLCVSSHREEEIPAILDRIASLSDPEDVLIRARIGLAQSIYTTRRDFNRSRAVAEAAVAQAGVAGDRYLIARAQYALTMVLQFQNDYDAMLPVLEAACDGLLRSRADGPAIRAGIHLSTHLWHMGQLQESEERLNRIKPLLAESRDPLLLAFYNEAIGRQHLVSGEFDKALLFFQESYRTWQAVGCAYQEGDQLHSLSTAFLGKGQMEEARQHILLSAEAWYRDRNAGGLCGSLPMLARWLALNGRGEDARRVLTFANDFREELHLVLVAAILDEFERVGALLGGPVPHNLPVNLDSAYQLFQQIR